MKTQRLPNVSFSLGWTAVCLVFFLGGLLLALLSLEDLRLERSTNFAVLFAGTAISGFVASRATSRRVPVEALTASLLLLVLVHLSLRFWLIGPEESGEGALWLKTLRLGGTCSLGAVVGVLVGGRNRLIRFASAPWRWSVIAMVLTLGWILILCSLLLLIDRSVIPEGTPLWPNERGILSAHILLVNIMFVSVFLAGLTAQAISSTQNFGPCGSGGVWLVGFALYATISNGQLSMFSVALCALVGGVLLAAGAMGASVGYQLSGRQERERDYADLQRELMEEQSRIIGERLPVARVHSCPAL